MRPSLTLNLGLRYEYANRIEEKDGFSSQLINITDPTTIHHLGLYVGNGRMIEAARTGTFIRYASIDRPGYIGAVRPIAGSAAGAT